MSIVLIYDCDGVLRDERPSYLRCIAETVGFFDGGREATREEISWSNGVSVNDWIGTQLILEQRGKGVDLKKIKEHFQDLYLGKDRNLRKDGKFSGYINDELWLADKELLKRLKDKYPLAMVSGAPQREIKYTAKKNDALEYFKLIIGMHQCKNKHEGIKMALEHFDADVAYFCDDRPSGLKEAREPIEGKTVNLYGTLPPDPEAGLDIELMKMGAIGVFKNVDEYNRFLIKLLRV